MRYWEAISGGVEVVVLTPEPLFRGWRRFVQEVSFRFSQTLDQVRRRRRGWGYYFHFFMYSPPFFFSSPVYIGLIGCSTRWEEEEGVRLLFPFFMYFPLFFLLSLVCIGLIELEAKEPSFQVQTPFSCAFILTQVANTVGQGSIGLDRMVCKWQNRACICRLIEKLESSKGSEKPCMLIHYMHTCTVHDLQVWNETDWQVYWKKRDLTGNILT